MLSALKKSKAEKTLPTPKKRCQDGLSVDVTAVPAEAWMGGESKPLGYVGTDTADAVPGKGQR